MKAKTTLSIFLKEDFAISIVNAAVSKYLIFAIALFVSFSTFAQPDNLYNGRNIINTPPNGATTSNLKSSYNEKGVAPFSDKAKNARMQFLYTAAELKGGSVVKAKDGDKITKIAFHVKQHYNFGDPRYISNVTIRVGTEVTPANTDVYNWSPSENQIPQFGAIDTPVLTEVFSGPVTIPDMSYLSVDSEERWIEFNLSTPYTVTTTGSLIVDFSYSYDYNPSLGQQIKMSSTYQNYSTSFMTRGCYSDDNTLGKNLYSTSGGNAIAINTGGYKKYRPVTKFTFQATAENSQAVYFEPVRSPCLGEPVAIVAKNLYATGFTKFRWEVSNAPDTGFLSYTLPYDDTQPVLVVKQPAKRSYYRFYTYIGANTTGLGTDAGTADLKGVKTFAQDPITLTDKWIDDEVPGPTESAYFKVAPTATNSIWTSNSLSYCSIAIAEGVTFKVPANKTLILNNPIVEADIEDTGKLVFENNSALLQNTEELNTNLNVEYKRTTPLLNRYDFTYYSSPVAGATLYDVSPATLWDKYFSYANDNWVLESPSNIMTAGKGYIIRAPQTYEISGNPLPFAANFNGRPNNGPIAITVSPTVGHFNLIGNPYPSEVDPVKFVQANTALDGTIYLWRHINAPSLIEGTHYYGYNNTDYLTVNNLGSTDGPAVYKVAAGQSFMIKTINETGSSVGWNNQMRIATGSTPAQFYKMQNTDPAKEVKEVLPSAGRFWLELKANSGALQRILVGYVAGATENYDRMYDAEQINSGDVAFYSIANDQQQLAIMAKGLPFNREDVIPLGFTAATAGNHTISKFMEDGFMSDYAVYINDKLTNTVHNLSQSDYTFATAAGAFNDRFVIAFKLKNTNLVDAMAKPNQVVIFDKAEAVQLHSGQELMNTIVIYDLSGRVLARKLNCNSAEVALSSLPRKNQLLVVEIHLENGTVETQKFRF